MISWRSRIIIGLAVVIAAAAIVLGDEYFRETLKLPSRTVGVFAALFVVGSTVATLWVDVLRDGARRPDRASGRKAAKKRS